MSFNFKHGQRWFADSAALLLLSVFAAEPCSADVHLTVGTLAQGAQYTTVQAAVDAVPANNTERQIIEIMPGTYTARVKIPSNKPLITLRGQDPLTTILTYNETANTPPNESTVHASTVVQGADFVAENLTFANSFGTGAQALAIYAKADRLIFFHCRFLGWQDTLRSEFGRQYFYNVYVEGSVDFIYGKGTAYFENSTLFAKSNGYVTAQAREGAAETNGYVFKNSTVTGSANNGSVYLGRPWQPYARVVYIDSKLGPVVSSAGWSIWPGTNNHLTAYFAEFNSMDLNGNPLNVTQRVSWSHQLTAAEADAFSKANWLGGADGWNPVIDSVVALPGDYNNDHVVDAADYTVWRNSLSSDTPLMNETASPNIVDDADYDVWKANYGASNGAGSSSYVAVPEPRALGLAITCVMSAGRRRRRAK